MRAQNYVHAAAATIAATIAAANAAANATAAHTDATVRKYGDNFVHGAASQQQIEARGGVPIPQHFAKCRLGHLQHLARRM